MMRALRSVAPLLAAVLLFLFLPLVFLEAQNSGWAFNQMTPGHHRGAVTALVNNGNEIISAGEDGFIEIYDYRKAAATERFQVSALPIKDMVKRPGADEVCIVESDGLGLYRIAVWNYRKRENLFTLRFSDTIVYVNYAANGSFIIAARSGRTGFVFIDSHSGELLDAPDTSSGAPVFAATGRTARSMMAYFPSGLLGYWDVSSGKSTASFQVPTNLTQVVMFGGNRYLAGISAEGLVVVDAVSGELLDRNAQIPVGSLLCATATDLFCMVKPSDVSGWIGLPDATGDAGGIYRFTLDRQGKFVRNDFISLPPPTASGYFSVFQADGEKIILGMDNGFILLYDHGKGWHSANTYAQQSLIALAVSGNSIAFLTDEHQLGFLPLNYQSIRSNYSLTLESPGLYTKISSVMRQTNKSGQFLLWQSDNTSLFPRVVSADKTETPVQPNATPLRFPMKAASLEENKVMLLDTAGNLSVLSRGGNSRPFTFSARGALDALLADNDNVVVCRSAVSNNTPFLLLSSGTGETVPLQWSASVGITAYRGSSGGIYAVTVDEGETGGAKTEIIRLNTANPSLSIRLVEYQGEDTQFSLAEAGGALAATIGTGTAAIYSGGGVKPFERTPGLPVQLSGGGNYFVSLDSEGNVCWYDVRTAVLLAMFKLYQDEWILQTAREGIIGKPVGASTVANTP